MSTRKLIAHATSDENGAGTGGAHGDQKGFELNACPWYKYPWLAVFRPKNIDKGNGMAAFMEDAISNGYLGYDQDVVLRRETIRWMDDHNYKVKTLNENKIVDCSALVYAAILSQYGIAYSSNGDVAAVVPKTSVFERYLMEVLTPADPYGGFEKFTDAAHLDSTDNLKRGDILLASGHVAMWI